MSRVSVLAAVLVAAACGDDTSSTPDGPPSLDAFEPAWWAPTPGEVTSWDIQLAAPYDTTAARGMYILDLFAVTPGGTLTYGDGSTVALPPGVLAGTIDALHARTPAPKVICRINTATIRLTDPDAVKLPGYEADPPDDPTDPAVGSVIGWEGYSTGERFLDVRAAARARWLPLLLARYDHAAAIGCDGVMPDGNDLIRSATGFGTLAIEDQQALYEEVAAASHARVLSVGQRFNTSLPGQTDELADDFDWVLPERCAEFDDCFTARPYLNQRKAAFAVDYQRDVEADTGVSLALACETWLFDSMVDGVLKDDGLTGAFSMRCE